jgi:hypothetical protein
MQFVQLSTKVIQSGNHEDLDHVMEENERQHQLQLEALEAEMDAEEAEHDKRLTTAINEELLNNANDHHKRVLGRVNKRARERGFPE